MAKEIQIIHMQGTQQEREAILGATDKVIIWHEPDGSIYQSHATGWSQTHAAGSAALAYDNFDQPVVGETMSFAVASGGVATATATTANVTAANIPCVTTIPTGRKRLVIEPSWSENTGGICNINQALFAVNCGNQALAAERFNAFIDPAKQCLNMIGSAASAKTLTDTGVIAVGRGMGADLLLDEDITDLYGPVILAAATPVVGELTGSVRLMEVPNA
jgi:hypothetical protein